MKKILILAYFVMGVLLLIKSWPTAQTQQITISYQDKEIVLDNSDKDKTELFVDVLDDMVNGSRSRQDNRDLMLNRLPDLSSKEADEWLDYCEFVGAN